MPGYLRVPSASQRSARPGNRVVVLGASIENLHSFRTATAENFGYDWPTYAMLLSGGRFNLIQNMAIGGQTTDQFIARFDTDVTPYAPNIVPMGSIENDIQALGALSYTNPQMLAHHIVNIKTLTAKCRAIGALPVWRTAMPHSTTTVHPPTGAYNAWLRRYCSVEGLPFVDMWSVLVDQTTGLYKAQYTADGVHPNENGNYLLAQYWLSQMQNYLPPLSTQPAEGASDTGPMLSTPLFLTNTSGTPTGWSNGAVPTGGTFSRSMIADPNGSGAQLHRHSHTTSTGQVLQTLSNSVTTGFSDGDVMEISGYYSSDGGVQASVVVTINATSGNLSRVPVSSLIHSMDHGTYKQQFTLPTGTTSVRISLQSGPGTGVVDFSYPVLRNITKESNGATDPITGV